MNYRLDSDVYQPYGLVVPKFSNVSRDPWMTKPSNWTPSNELKQKLAEKTNQVKFDLYFLISLRYYIHIWPVKNPGCLGCLKLLDQIIAYQLLLWTPQTCTGGPIRSLRPDPLPWWLLQYNLQKVQVLSLLWECVLSRLCHRETFQDLGIWFNSNCTWRCWLWPDCTTKLIY